MRRRDQAKAYLERTLGGDAAAVRMALQLLAADLTHHGIAMSPEDLALPRANGPAPPGAAWAASAVRRTVTARRGCRVTPIVGPRFRSLTRLNFDLCARCHTLARAVTDPALADEYEYERLDPPGAAAAG